MYFLFALIGAAVSLLFFAVVLGKGIAKLGNYDPLPPLHLPRRKR